MPAGYMQLFDIHFIISGLSPCFASQSSFVIRLTCPARFSCISGTLSSAFSSSSQFQSQIHTAFRTGATSPHPVKCSYLCASLHILCLKWCQNWCQTTFPMLTVPDFTRFLALLLKSCRGRQIDSPENQ